MFHLTFFFLQNVDFARARARILSEYLTEEFYRDYRREPSIGSDTVQPQFSTGVLRSARESLPSVDSAVDSWGELGDGGGGGGGSGVGGGGGVMPEILRLWDTASVDSGQLDLSIPSYPGYV